MNLEELKNNNQIIILPSYDMEFLDSLNETFDKSVYVIEDNIENPKEIVEILNNGSVKNIIFVDYYTSYDKIIPNLKKKKIDYLFTHEIASITNPYTRMIFNKILEFNDRNLLNNVLILDKSTFEVLKKSSLSVKYQKLITNAKVSNKKTKNIGIISYDSNPNNNFYDMLTAIKMVDYDHIKALSCMKATSDFIDFFDINFINCDNIDDVIKDNYVNLYCNFTDNKIPLIIKSMNSKIPCIIGNCDIFDNYPILKENLVLKSDDDVNEIAEKINNIENVYNDIFIEYEKFKKEYLKG